MIDLECATCGYSIELEGTSDYRGDLTLKVFCKECSKTNEALFNQCSELNEIVLSQHEQIDQMNRELEELRDFIDGYIEDR